MNRFALTDSPHEPIRGEVVELGDGGLWTVPLCYAFNSEEKRFVSALPNYVPDRQRAAIDAACARTLAGLCGGIAPPPDTFLDNPEAFLTFNGWDSRRDAVMFLRINYELCDVQLGCLFRESEQRDFAADVVAAAIDAQTFIPWVREQLGAAPAWGD